VDTFVPEGSRQSVSDFQQQLINGNSAFTEYFENLIHTAYGDRLIAWHNALMHDADGNCTGIVGSGEDITDRKQMEEQLHLEKEQLEITLLSVGDGVISTDVEGRVRIINKAGEYLTGWNQRDAYGRPFSEVFPLLNETSRTRIENPVEQVLRTGKSVELAKHSLLITTYGLERPIEDSIAPIRDANGKIKGVVVVFRDCSESLRKESEILWLSYHDQLTGLHNRRSYEHEVHRLDDPAYHPLALVMADVNGLKLTNDAFGHTAGDELLRKIAGMLTQTARPGDIVARIGGDEFVMLLPRTSAPQVEEFIRKLQSTVNHATVYKLKISVSFGFAVKENPKEDMGDVFNRAEDDMYRHKLSESPSARTRTIELLLRSLFKKSNRELQHSRRVGDLCRSIALEVGLSANDARNIRTAGLLHDIGKIAVESEILNKPATLDDSEWLMIRRHPEVGYNILNSVPKYSSIAEFVLSHHEHWDGKGYPRGLKGDEIPLQARILSVADTYDAMLTDRTYHKGMDQTEVLQELKNCAGAQLDPTITRLFVEKILHQTWE
jgi:diguanylate cyclase (GGDEF)-like protein/PAS domain S-box-containing protein/putative nucleotidyltransferase with HDIG domain